MTRILGIETSCDETAASVVEDGRHILSNVVASQVDLHAQYGGIFPELASRAHIETIHPVVQKALDEAEMSLPELDAVAVTRGPGLAGSLVVGVNVAKGLALGTDLPLLGINHLEAHVYSLMLVEGALDYEFPLLALLVSGGHTELVLMTAHGRYRRLGGTLDDAAGEAFDKVGRLLNLPYPGGPSIEKAAREGDPTAFDFPRAWLPTDDRQETYDFSFSGLKTAVLRAVRRLAPDDEALSAAQTADLAASFQEAVVDVLATKTVRAAEAFEVRELFMAGGVSANTPLRERVAELAERPLRVPPLFLCTDNAAMVAAAGHYRFLAGQRDDWALDVKPSWPLT
jgi:N6-L-threonylcarbamoyladenine synthase